MLKLAVSGCQGRMGKTLVQAIAANNEIKLGAASIPPTQPPCREDVGTLAGVAPLDLQPVTDLSEVLDQFDILIDFTTPAATLAHVALCREHRKNLVIGTTGLNESQKKTLQEAAQDIAIVFSPNMSIGVNACFHLLSQAAKMLGDCDVEIVEAHHRGKVDAPSGTALKMQEILTAERSSKARGVGVSSLRMGDVMGDHTVLFSLPGERVEITHRAHSRLPFAVGAIRAAQWLANKKSGLYTMANVLGF